MNIRYTKGPDVLSLGKHSFKRGEWKEVTDDIGKQALLPARVKEYGFEQQRGED